MLDAKSEYIRKCHTRRLQTNQQYRKEDTQDILGLYCIFVFNIKLLYILKKMKYYINQSTYQNRSSMVYTKLHLMLCISSINGGSYSLMFTVYILKEKINVSPVTIEILYYFVNMIS